MPGMVVLAMRSGAPVVTATYGDRVSARCRIVFSEPARFVPDTDPNGAAQRGMQAWCDWFEAYLRQYPENWMFWLDKRWTRVLRTQSRARQAS